MRGKPEEMYGRRKMTRYLRRQGHEVAFCTVDRIMRELGLNGVVQGHKQRTTITAKDGIRAGDKLNRDFTACAPNHVWVADFTYVATWTGWSYVAFIIDAYSRAIVGWTAASTKTTALMSKALNMAVWRRDHNGHPIGPGLIHHSDAGSQGEFNWSSQHLDRGGVQGWRRQTGARRRPAMRLTGCGGSGVRIGRFGRRCVRPDVLTPRARSSDSSGS